jgi:segregation and condensation protein A
LTENEVLPQGKIKRVISLEERIKDLITKLAGGQEFKFTEIVNQNDKEDIIITFLAILHLIKEKIIEVEQKDIFGELIIKTKQNEQSK